MAKKDDQQSKSPDGEAPAVATGANQPQGATQPRRADVEVKGDVDIRTDAALSSELRLIPDAGEDVGEKQVQAQVDAENEVGFRGTASDPTPNRNYTLEGVTSGAPTPETSFAQRAAARNARTLREGPEPY